MERFATFSSWFVQRHWARYVLAIFLPLFTLGLQIHFHESFGSLRFLLFFTAVTLTALFCGFIPSLITLGLSVFFANFFIPEGTSFSNASIQTVVFGGTAFLICAFSHFLRQRDRALFHIATRAEVVERISDGFFALDSDWFFTYVNHTTTQIAGKAPPELLKKNIWEVFPEAKQTVFYEKFTEAMKNQVSVSFQAYYPPLDRWVDMTVYPATAGISVFFKDITESKKNEQKLREQSALLAKSNHDLTRSNSELAQFAEVASHDLREPLRTIITHLQLLERILPKDMPSQGKEYINLVIGSARHLNSLINDVLELSRIGNSALLDHERVDCSRALDLAKENLRIAITETQASIQHQNMPVIYANNAQIVQLFQNLLANSMKYRSQAPPVIRVSCEPINDGYLFRVTDNGIGLAYEHRSRIFSMFRRVHGRSEYPGNGIGLAVCKKIVERYGGKIWVESELGKGATFCFTMPEARPRLLVPRHSNSQSNLGLSQ